MTRVLGSVQRCRVCNLRLLQVQWRLGRACRYRMFYEMSIRSCRVNVEASELLHSVSIVLFLIGVTVWVVSRYRKGRTRQAVGTSSAVPISKSAVTELEPGSLAPAPLA